MRRDAEEAHLSKLDRWGDGFALAVGGQVYAEGVAVGEPSVMRMVGVVATNAGGLLFGGFRVEDLNADFPSWPP